MIAHISVFEPSTVKILSDKQFEYMEAKFSVMSTKAAPVIAFMPGMGSLTVTTGHNAYQLALGLLQDLSKRLPFFSMQCVEINQYYTDLHSPDFKYVKLERGEFQNLQSESYTSESYAQQMSVFENRMTKRSGKNSKRPSYLFIVKPKCKPDCGETHGQTWVLATGQNHQLQQQQLFRTLLKKQKFEKTVLNDFCQQFVGKGFQAVYGIAKGNEEEVVAELVEMGGVL
ncbi:Hypothetical_protein [Hexamita inflata]|uniref:Hypothetical_protein n=1 Tax=Hexamita inflata TaxID=28002 RepID=A0AA86TY37_9EUKA|nr:Hypothetical protein HINF_LOCUS19022 [Hexamita inflata]